MNKFFKNISVFFLWLAGLTLSVHLLLPHDHHFADTFSNQDKNCHGSKNKSNHNSGFPIHCHAFNDLFSEKAITYVISKYIHSDNISTGCYPDALTFNLPISGITITNKPEYVPVSYMLGLSTLRAPPSLI
ncbi:MAG: hypothetical protein A2V46_15035 [Bacteroidetes bacterium RBG_19FT_COMBO_42_7]|nr:MAG: hypothetical protein A2V46_15035 [Bacteroidetes bacterium RBG_19FT_COMBO_42_7]